VPQRLQDEDGHQDGDHQQTEERASRSHDQPPEAPGEGQDQADDEQCQGQESQKGHTDHRQPVESTGNGWGLATERGGLDRVGRGGGGDGAPGGDIHAEARIVSAALVHEDILARLDGDALVGPGPAFDHRAVGATQFTPDGVDLSILADLEIERVAGADTLEPEALLADVHHGLADPGPLVGGLVGPGAAIAVLVGELLPVATRGGRASAGGIGVLGGRRCVQTEPAVLSDGFPNAGLVGGDDPTLELPRGLVAEVELEPVVFRRHGEHFVRVVAFPIDFVLPIGRDLQHDVILGGLIEHGGRDALGEHGRNVGEQEQCQQANEHDGGTDTLAVHDWLLSSLESNDSSLIPGR
jgi:hypothetical protein